MNPQILIPKTTSRAARRRRPTGFTLVEVLVSMVILLMMMLIITQVIGTVQRTWRQASSRLSQFREARGAFDTITRGLAQATINSYRTYDYGYGGPPGLPTSALQAPVGYVRTAELGIKMGLTDSMFKLGAQNLTPGHAVLFQAPLGYTDDSYLRTLDRLLCVRGYFVYFSNDIDFLPVGLSGRLESKSRFRLYEYQPTTETNMVFSDTATGTHDAWTTVTRKDALDNSRPVAENILTLIMAPSFPQATGGGAPVLFSQGSKAESYSFSSYIAGNNQYQLPSSIQVVMVAMDEETATRVAQQYGSSPPQLFPSRFTNPANLNNDLKLVRESLLKQKINFRIFTSTVTIPAADS